MEERVKWNWDFFVRWENRCPRRKTSWNKVEKHSTTIYMTSSPKSNLRHIGSHRTWNVTPLITMTTQLQKEGLSRQGPVQENVLYPWCWWCRCFRVYVGWCFFFAYLCPCRSLRSNRISKIEKNAFNYSRNLIYLWVKIKQLLLLSFLLRAQERPATLILTVISGLRITRAMFITGMLKPEIQILFCN